MKNLKWTKKSNELISCKDGFKYVIYKTKLGPRLELKTKSKNSLFISFKSIASAKKVAQLIHHG